MSNNLWHSSSHYTVVISYTRLSSIVGNSVLAFSWMHFITYHVTTCTTALCLEGKQIYPVSRLFFLAWLLAFLNAMAWLVSRIVGLFTPGEKPLQWLAVCGFHWACAEFLNHYFKDNDINFITWKKYVQCHQPISCFFLNLLK